jgi:hypothetical protein
LLKGAISVIGPTKMIAFAFDKLGTSTGSKGARSETKEGVTMTLRDFRVEPDRWTAVIALDYPPDAPDFESFESWLVNNEIYLQKNGSSTRIPANGGYEIDDQAGHRAVMTYRFIEDEKVTLGKPEDWKLVYRTAGTIVKVPVRFEFKDLPLP